MYEIELKRWLRQQPCPTCKRSGEILLTFRVRGTVPQQWEIECRCGHLGAASKCTINGRESFLLHR